MDCLISIHVQPSSSIRGHWQSLSPSLYCLKTSLKISTRRRYKKTFCWQTHVIGIRKLLSLCCAFSSGIRDRAVVPQNNWHHFGISNSIYLLLQRVNIYIVHAKNSSFVVQMSCWLAWGFLKVVAVGRPSPWPLEKGRVCEFFADFLKRKSSKSSCIIVHTRLISTLAGRI